MKEIIKYIAKYIKRYIIKRRIEYLSNNFDNPKCRKELYNIIHGYLNKKAPND